MTIQFDKDSIEYKIIKNRLYVLPETKGEWVYKYFSWFMINIIFAATPIIISITVMFLVNLDQIDKKQILYANALSIVVLSITTIIVNTKFDVIHTMYRPKSVDVDRNLGYLLVIVGLVVTVSLHTGLAGSSGTVIEDNFAVLVISLFALSIILSLHAYTVKLYADQSASTKLLPSIHDELSEKAQKMKDAMHEALNIPGMKF